MPEPVCLKQDVCFKALSLALCLPLPPSLPSPPPPGANPPDSTTSSLCPPKLAGLLGRLSSLTYSVTQGSLFLTSRSVSFARDSTRSALSLSFRLWIDLFLSIYPLPAPSLPIFLWVCPEPHASLFAATLSFLWRPLRLISNWLSCLCKALFAQQIFCPFHLFSLIILSSSVPLGYASGQCWCHGG